MMTGYVRQKHNVSIVEKRLGTALSMVSPNYGQQIKATTRAVNPIPCRADYFGYELHINQNEKLVMYWVTWFAAIHGQILLAIAGTTMSVITEQYTEKSNKDGSHLISTAKYSRIYF